MIDRMMLVAQDDFNAWLEQNPLVLGLIFLALGLVIGGWGLYELLTGTAYSKRGKAMTGTSAKVLAIVRVVGGVFCLGFGAYKLLAG